jgi:hypothetical protein
VCISEILVNLYRNARNYSAQGSLYYCLYIFWPMWVVFRPIRVAALSGAWTIFVHSHAGIMVSSPTRGMHVCVRLFCVCVVLCVGSGLVKGWSPVQGVLPTVYRIKKMKIRQNPRGCRATKREGEGGGFLRRYTLRGSALNLSCSSVKYYKIASTYRIASMTVGAVPSGLLPVFTIVVYTDVILRRSWRWWRRDPPKRQLTLNLLDSVLTVLAKTENLSLIAITLFA